MKKISIIVSFIMFFSLSTGLFHVQAATKTFANCKQLNKVYHGGVAISKTTKNKGGRTKFKAFVSKSLYLSNKRLDRDKDGIACER